MKSWTNRGTWAALLCCVGMAYADRPDNPAEPVDWDVLPNGLIGVQYDRTGDGAPDHVALHQITWPGWDRSADFGDRSQGQARRPVGVHRGL